MHEDFQVQPVRAGRRDGLDFVDGKLSGQDQTPYAHPGDAGQAGDGAAIGQGGQMQLPGESGLPGQGGQGQILDDERVGPHPPGQTIDE